MCVVASSESVSSNESTSASSASASGFAPKTFRVVQLLVGVEGGGNNEKAFDLTNTATARQKIVNLIPPSRLILVDYTAIQIVCLPVSSQSFGLVVLKMKRFAFSFASSFSILYT